MSQTTTLTTSAPPNTLSSSSPSSNTKPSPSPSTTTLYPISHLDHVTYLFGHPIAHSLSPLLHKLIYSALNLNWSYLLHESTSIPSFLSLLSDTKCIGAAVTMPHKVAIIPFLDSLSPAAKAIGAVNTIYFQPSPPDSSKQRLMVGHNTDCIGIREAFRQTVSKETYEGFRGQPALVVGGGGTSRAAVYALTTYLGCEPVYIINRDPAEVSAVQSEVQSGFGATLTPITSVSQASSPSLKPPRVIVSAIPDFEPRTDAEKEVRAILETLLERGSTEDSTMLEMCYHPSPRTRIAKLGQEKGWRVVGGIQAMVWQGVEQDRIWTGREAGEMDVERVRGEVEKANEAMREHK